MINYTLREYITETSALKTELQNYASAYQKTYSAYLKNLEQYSDVQEASERKKKQETMVNAHNNYLGCVVNILWKLSQENGATAAVKQSLGSLIKYISHIDKNQQKNEPKAETALMTQALDSQVFWSALSAAILHKPDIGDRNGTIVGLFSSVSVSTLCGFALLQVHLISANHDWGAIIMTAWLLVSVFAIAASTVVGSKIGQNIDNCKKTKRYNAQKNNLLTLTNQFEEASQSPGP